jgi:Protein of unknown function (DUF2442)
MIKIVHACWIKNQQIALVFSDGGEGVYDFAPWLAHKTPLIQPLQDTARFQKFFLELGALCWPHGLFLFQIINAIILSILFDGERHGKTSHRRCSSH